VGAYKDEDGIEHEMTWFKFTASPGQVLRGKGINPEIGEYVLQGYVEANGRAHFEKQYYGTPTHLFEGDLKGERIEGT
jgi:hypothetical protein